MTAEALMTSIIGNDFLAAHKDTLDTCRYGDPAKPVSKVGVCLTATPSVIEQAQAWGADLLITHEPTFYNYPDVPDDGMALSRMKCDLLDRTGMTLWRCHDSLHYGEEDLIHAGLVRAAGLEGTFVDANRFRLQTPLTARALAEVLSRSCHIRYPRIIGDADAVAGTILLSLGQCAAERHREFLLDDALSVELCGELCEWRDGEPVRDAAQMGLRKAILVLGHAASESPGMALLATQIEARFEGVSARFFDGGELYSYTK